MRGNQKQDVHSKKCTLKTPGGREGQLFSNHVVSVPKVPGKIVSRSINGNVYVEYEIQRVYDPNRKQNVPQRVRIGVKIPGRPEMMLPNENYFTYFPKEEEKMTDQEKATVKECENEREYRQMLQDFFDQLFFEFRIQSRKKPNSVVSEYKVERLNRILKPLMEMMKGERYTEFLEEIPMPVTTEDENGQKTTTGLTYSDVALMLTQFKGAVNRFSQR